MAQVTPEQSAAYVKSGGLKCPLCGSSDITGDGQVELDAGHAWQNVRCSLCGAEWIDCYDLVAAESTQD